MIYFTLWKGQSEAWVIICIHKQCNNAYHYDVLITRIFLKGCLNRNSIPSPCLILDVELLSCNEMSCLKYVIICPSFAHVMFRNCNQTRQVSIYIALKYIAQSILLNNKYYIPKAAVVNFITRTTHWRIDFLANHITHVTFSLGFTTLYHNQILILHTPF